MTDSSKWTGRRARVPRDRLDGRSIGPWWFRVSWTRYGDGLSVWALRRRLFLWPIDYALAERQIAALSR